MATLTLRNIKKVYGDVEVIQDLSLDIEDREFVVLVGPSGCGKSTLLRMIAGLEEISGGDLSIDNERVNELPPDRRGLAMVFQSYALYPHMTVADNMAFALRLAGVSREERMAKVGEAAKILHLEPLLDRKPRALSGGQRQRVAIGRAIVREPRVFLFDEPLSNLDAALRVQMRIEIARLHNSLDATMVYVTHDQVEAMTMADKIVVMNAGHIEQVGSPLDLYHHPESLFVAGFIGSPKMNFIDAKVSSVSSDGTTVALSDGTEVTVPVSGGGMSAGDVVTMGVRPEELQAVTDDPANPGDLAGRVIVAERLGGETFLYTEVLDGQTLNLKGPGAMTYRVNDAIRLRIDGATCHLFRDDGKALPRLARNPMADLDAEPVAPGAAG